MGYVERRWGLFMVVYVKRAVMSVMTEGCEGRSIEGRHVLLAGG